MTASLSGNTPGSGWTEGLRDDETVRWVGHPDTGFRITAGVLAAGLGAAALALGALGLATVIERSIPGTYWTILGPGLAIAGGIAATPPILDRHHRRRRRYRITTHRVQIMRGTLIESYPLPPADQLQLSGDAPKTITLGHDSRNRPINLERLADADAVLALLKDTTYREMTS